MKKIIWDIGNVVIFVDEGRLPFDYFNKNKDWHDLETGKIDSELFFKKYPDCQKTFNSVFTENTFVTDIINKLPKEQQYFFSNTNDAHFKYLQTKFSVFDTSNLFLSFEIGLRKPEPEAYIFVQQSLSTNDILFIDDKPENLIIPKSLGWQTFLYKQNNQNLLEAIYE